MQKITGRKEHTEKTRSKWALGQVGRGVAADWEGDRPASPADSKLAGEMARCTVLTCGASYRRDHGGDYDLSATLGGPEPEPYQRYEPQPRSQAPQPPRRHDPRWEPDPRFAPQPQSAEAWASYQPPAQNPAPVQQQRRPSRPGTKRRWPYVPGVVAIAVMSFAAGESAGRSGKTASPSAPASQAAAQPAAVASSAATPAKAVARSRVLARFRGSGIENTSRFTVAGSGNWELRWSYNCASLGSSGNFIVSEDGGSDFQRRERQ
jgi:hypothetical protein